MQSVAGFQVLSVHCMALFVLDTFLLPMPTRSLRLVVYMTKGSARRRGL
ncbi:MAG: hypothetical protein AVDCRST_MAG93-4005 [uncultured Chloroflexia bacterium]|uniref:Uncharacterized protein n=1 Tax=uncultured Chloroflexia bacterium TaxID=1672391 RepID=A0A6J4K0D8_9CHLR|nr:MAG: hypothetical protein AVDCRST_MAG93-4005 [uncultured Chloroflexia bacterium]